MATNSSGGDSAYKAGERSDADKSNLYDHLQQLDFVSGLTHQEILVYLLHTFKHLAGADAVAVLERKMSFHGYKVVGSLINDALPVKMRQLETGSQAELVHAVNEFVPGDNWSIGNMAAEKDIMAVAALQDIFGQNAKISIIPIIENKCFLRMRLRLNPGVQIKADSFLSKLLVSYDGRIYISPLKFMHQVALGLGKAYSRLKETEYFKNISEHYFMAEFEEHGAAVMVSFHEVPPTSSLLADLLEKKNLKPRLLINGVPQSDGVKPEEVTKPDAQVQVKFEKAQPGEGVPVEDPFHGFREEMAADVDIVPAIHLPIWPSALNEWKTRDRMWPSKQLIQKIVKEGVMIVHKAPKNGCELTDWRLSFSKAEIMLISNTEFPCRQHAHRIFKSFVNHMMRPAPKLVTSYHCKTVLLWACERIPPEHWTWERLSFCVLGLIDDMIACIAKKSCPHYFVPEVNLFENVPDDFLQTCGQKLVELRKNFPDRHLLQHARSDGIEMGFILSELGVRPSKMLLSQEPCAANTLKEEHFVSRFLPYHQLMADGAEIYLLLLRYKYGISDTEYKALRRLVEDDEKQARENPYVQEYNRQMVSREDTLRALDMSDKKYEEYKENLTFF